MIKKQEVRDTLRAVYLKHWGVYQLFFESDGMTHLPVLTEPFFRFIAAGWDKKISKISEELKEYGITKKDIERVIVQASKQSNIKPPKYLIKKME